MPVLAGFFHEILSIFYIFPCDLLEPNYTDDESGLLCARTELQRRDEYMQKITPQLSPDHPLIRMIQQCMQNVPKKRPGVRDVLQLLEQAGSLVVDEGCEMNKLELLQDRYCKTSEKAELTEQLMRNEAELTRAKENIRRKQQQIQEMVRLMICSRML